MSHSLNRAKITSDRVLVVDYYRYLATRNQSDPYICAVKVLVFIILLVCIAATVVPCCVVDNCSMELEDSHDTEKQKGACSPFFTCTSCASCIITTDPIEMPVLIASLLPVYQAHPNSPLLFRSSSFWQPPKLS